MSLFRFLYFPSRLMAPHPDDETIGAAGYKSQILYKPNYLYSCLMPYKYAQDFSRILKSRVHIDFNKFVTVFDQLQEITFKDASDL